jgi:Holliday junction resolvasome RuvABC endonuclease subunit
MVRIDPTTKNHILTIVLLQSIKITHFTSRCLNRIENIDTNLDKIIDERKNIAICMEKTFALVRSLMNWMKSEWRG